MEPIASSAGAVFRPSGAASDAAALLRQGRILAAEVLARSADGTVQLALGRHVVPAKTELSLEPGARFLVRVAEEAGEPVLLLVAPPADEEPALLAALRRVIGDERPLGELLGELARALRDAAEPPAEARALARGLAGLVARPDAPPSGAALRALLVALGLGHEAALAAAARGGAERAATADLRSDLKALLFSAQSALEREGASGDDVGEAHELARTIARALAGLEAEQLLNLARRHAGEPSVLAFPFPDGERWATARLAVPPRDPGARATADAPEVVRVALELELTRLGPLRADLTLAPAHLAVRITVARPELALRLAPGLERLRAALGASGSRNRTIDLSVRSGSTAEIRQGFQLVDVAWLSAQPLVDVAG